MLSLPLARSFHSSPSLDNIFGSRVQQQPKHRFEHAGRNSRNNQFGVPSELASTPLLREIDSVHDIQEGSLIISKVESSLGCHDLRQPYFHKAIVLVLDHDPDDFTQGVLLNRASDLILDGKDILYVDDGESDDTQASSTSWRIHFGGDIGGWYEENPQLLCLHGIDTEASRAVSDPIFEENSDIGNVYITSHRGALSLVQAGEATPDMFYTFSGFCGWEPGQLEREVDRNSWCLASFVQEEENDDNDGHPLMNLLEKYSWKNKDYRPQSGGLEFWEQLVADLGKDKGYENDEAKNRPQAFSDMMVKEWATQRLIMAGGDDGSLNGTSESNEKKPTSQIDDQDIFRALKAASENDQLGPGAILRASPVNSYLLDAQLFHKSTILVLQESPSTQVSIGVILNLVTNDVYTLVVDGKEYNFPIRYGGYSGKEQAQGKQEEEQYFWFHNNQLLKENDFGLPISFSSASPESTSQDFSCIYACDFGEVSKALELGLAKAADFLLVQGFCAWEKQGSSGGLNGQILNGNLEDTRWFQKTASGRESLWRCLRDQKQPTSEFDLQNNLALSISAWEQGAREKTQEEPKETRLVFGTDVTVSELADEALFIWMKLFLLSNRVYLPVD